MSEDGSSMSVELVRLRGEMTTGFAKIGGQLDVIASNQGQVRRDLDSLEGRVTALEARRVPLGLLAAVSGAVSAVVAAGAFLVQL